MSSFMSSEKRNIPNFLVAYYINDCFYKFLLVLSSNSSLSVLKYFNKILVKIVLASWIGYGHFI